MKISPIRYMGNKNKLIKNGLINLFPKNIATFYDLFAGSGAVAYNTSADRYLINDIDFYIFSLYQLFQKINSDDILGEILENIEKYNLPKFSTDLRRNGMTKEIREMYRQNFIEARAEFNKNLNPINILILMYYSMSTTIRINSVGKYNMPFGNGYYIEDKHGKQITKFTQWFKDNKVHISNQDYKEYKTYKFEANDFVYLDPPYLYSTATYNEQGKWGTNDQDYLLKFCDELDTRGIKFGLSNTLRNKGNVNTKLKEWINSRNYDIYEFTGFDYCTFGTGLSNTQEIYITNVKKK